MVRDTWPTKQLSHEFTSKVNLRLIANVSKENVRASFYFFYQVMRNNIFLASVGKCVNFGHQSFTDHVNTTGTHSV